MGSLPGSSCGRPVPRHRPGRLSRQQEDLIEYLREEKRVLREQLGRPLRLNAANFTGSWETVFIEELFASGSARAPSKAFLTFAQSGATGTGTFRVEGLGGELSGTVRGNTMVFVIDQALPCPGRFVGHLELRGGEIEGIYTGNYCLGGLEARVRARRQ